MRTLLAEGMRVVSASRATTPGLAETGRSRCRRPLHPGGPPTRRAGRRCAGRDRRAHQQRRHRRHRGCDKGALLNLIDLPDSAWDTFNLHFYSALRVSRAALPSLIGDAARSSTSPRRARDWSRRPGRQRRQSGTQCADQGHRRTVRRPGRRASRSLGPVATGVWTDPEGFIARLAREQGSNITPSPSSSSAAWAPQRAVSPPQRSRTPHRICGLTEQHHRRRVPDRRRSHQERLRRTASPQRPRSRRSRRRECSVMFQR